MNMMAISANEVDRMLYKKGLASPTVLKTCHNEMMRRAWANRRVSEHVTKLSNIQALIRDHPPVSPLIKPCGSPHQLAEQQSPDEQPSQATSSAIDARTAEAVAKKNLDQMRAATNGTDTHQMPGTTSASGTVRKSLMLSQAIRQGMHQDSEQDLDGHNILSGRNQYDSNMSPMDESESFIQLVPKQN